MTDQAVIENHFNQCHSVTLAPARKRWHTRHPVYCLSVTFHDQHRKKADRETPAETA